MNKNIAILGLLLLLGVVGCTSPNNEPVAPANDSSIVVRYGTSFGNCISYCNTRMTVDSVDVVFTKYGGGRSGTTPPDSIRTFQIALDEWRAIITAIDFAAIASLDTVIGCPDCADGGAEWIEVVRGSDQPRRVTIEYGATIPAIKDLVDRLRDVHRKVR